MSLPVLFLESASGHTQAVTPDIALQTAKKLVGTLRKARGANKQISLNSNTHIGDSEVAPAQTLGMLLGGQHHREEWLFLRELATRSPLSHGLETWIEKAELAEAKLSSEKSSTALTWANLLETGTVSFHAQPAWMQPWVSADCLSLDDHCNEISRRETIRNISSPEHVVEHNDWLKALGLEPVVDSRRLWEERETRFPGLRFLAQVEHQIYGLATTGAPFKQAIQCLGTLSGDAVQWDGKGVPTFSSKVADGEHDQRRSLSKFTDELHGREFTFDRHAYFTGGIPGRIHFRLATDEKKFVVAHVGFKL